MFRIVIDGVFRLYEILLFSLEDIINIFLGIEIDEWKHRTLNLDHDFVIPLEIVEDVVKIKDNMRWFIWFEWHRLTHTIAEPPTEH